MRAFRALLASIKGKILSFLEKSKARKARKARNLACRATTGARYNYRWSATTGARFEIPMAAKTGTGNPISPAEEDRNHGEPPKSGPRQSSVQHFMTVKARHRNPYAFTESRRSLQAPFNAAGGCRGVS